MTITNAAMNEPVGKAFAYFVSVVFFSLHYDVCCSCFFSLDNIPARQGDTFNGKLTMKITFSKPAKRAGIFSPLIQTLLLS